MQHYYIVSHNYIDCIIFQGIAPKETETSKQHNQKWTMDAKEKYMRDQGKTSVQLGLVAPPVTESNNKKKLSPV